MYTNTSFQMDKDSPPQFWTVTEHNDGSFSISLVLSKSCWLGFTGSVAQLEKLRDEISVALNKIEERANLAELAASNT